MERHRKLDYILGSQVLFVIIEIILSRVPNNRIKLEMNNYKISRKSPNILKLVNLGQKEVWREIRKYFELMKWKYISKLMRCSSSSTLWEMYIVKNLH